MTFARAWTAMLLVCVAASCGGERDSRPNFLILSIDTLRADHLGLYGHGRDTSPRIDALGAGGVVFESAYSSSSWTLPAFASAVTSLYPSTHGVQSLEARLDESFRTLPEFFRDAGYDTCGVTSHNFFSTQSGMRQGFIHFDEELVLETDDLLELVSSEGVSDRGIRWIERKAGSADDLPWLLWLHYFDPHDAYKSHAGSAFGDERPVDRYDGEIAHTDLHLGRVLDALDEHGFAENTVVLLFADHGEEFGDHGKTNHAHTLYRELVRIPLIVRAPGIAPRRVDQNVRMIDLLPTALELAGIGQTSDVVGRSLVPLMRGEGLPDEPALMELSIDPDHAFEALVDGNWKLIRVNRPASEELFDLAADPGEKNDLSAAEPERLARMREQLDALRDEARAKSLDYHQSLGHGLTQAEIDELTRLGYIGDD